MRFYCIPCGEYRPAMVDFDGGRWCLVCDTEWQHEQPLVVFAAVVFGELHHMVTSEVQSDVPATRVRMTDVVTRQSWILPAGHLHLVYS
jgi:hypothetical protein